MIVDASVLLMAFFPDEAQAQAQELVRAHVAGEQSLKAPALLTYELSNAVWQAERRQRITPLQGDAILQALLGLEIELLPQSWQELLPLARRFGCSAYDAAYLALSQATGEPLVTGDQRLYHLVRPNFTGVQWIGEG